AVRGDLEEMPLPGGFDQPLPPRPEDIATVELQLPAQFLDGLPVFVDGLLVDLSSLIERGPEVLDLLVEPVEQVVTVTRIGGPRGGRTHNNYYRMSTPYFKGQAADFRPRVWDVDTACVAAPSPGRCRRGSAITGWRSSRSRRLGQGRQGPGTSRSPAVCTR